MSPLC
jgi:Protein of unknown function (DUF4446)